MPAVRQVMPEPPSPREQEDVEFKVGQVATQTELVIINPEGNAMNVQEALVWIMNHLKAKL